MATRSRIGIELSDGSVLSAYHHWDGYPEWLGRILKTHYNSKELAAELIDGGDMSCCWTKDRFSIDPTTGYKVEEYGPQYYSQRGEDTPPRRDSNLNEYLSNGEEYWYLFTNGEWVCYSNDSRGLDMIKEVEIPNGALLV
jgi:hypothetical protein